MAATATVVIRAAFAGRCKVCRSRFSVGDPIGKVGYKTWVCQNCFVIGNGHAEPAAPEPPDVPVEESVPEPAAPAPAEANIRAVVRKELEGATLQVDEGEVRGLVRDELTQAGVIRHEVVVKDGDGVELRKLDGRPHACFEKVVKLAAARRNILLVGPAGCGKTFLAGKVAEALGLEFKFISCTAGMSEGQLTGRLVPIGAGGSFAYLRSDFVRLYEEGGVFLFDEIDAADSNTLLVLNAALANGHMAVPNRPENPTAKKHPNFVAIAAANTFGTGADRQYVGRNQLDESTLDRFRIGQVEMDYDPEVEKAVCPDDDLRTRLQGFRRRVRECKIRRIVSTRFLQDAYIMKRAGFTDEEIDQALFSGYSSEELAKVRGS